MIKNDFEQDMKIFIHRGESHYSFKGHYISCERYGFLQSLGKGRDEIMFEEAQSFAELDRKEREKEIAQRKKEYPEIHNFKELVAFMLTILKPEIAQEIKDKRGGCKTTDEFIQLFPGVFQAILRLRFLHDKGMQEREKAELKSLEKTLVTSVTYNPDAFIGE